MCQKHRTVLGPALGRRAFVGLASAFAVAPLLGGCDDGLPVDLVSDETIERMGLETWAQIRAETPASRDARLQGVLNEVGTRLLAAAGEEPRRWEMVVFAGDEPNAFALPGRKVGVYEGMFRIAGDRDQLAAVIGHEIGHGQAEHSQERMNAAAAKELGLRVASAALQAGDVAFAEEIAALLGIGAEFGIVLPYSRRQELEADRLGLGLMVRAGYRPEAAVELWRRMAAAGGGGGPGFLSTHPAPEARIEAIEALLPDLKASAGRG